MAYSSYGGPGQPTISSFAGSAPRFANSARPPGIGGNIGSGSGLAGQLAPHQIPLGGFGSPLAPPPAPGPPSDFMQRLANFNPYQRQQFAKWVQAVQAGQRHIAPHPLSGYGGGLQGQLTGTQAPITNPLAHPTLPMNQLHNALAARAESGADQHPIAQALLSALARRF